MIARRISMASLVATGVVTAASAQTAPTRDYSKLPPPQKAVVQGFATLPEKITPPSTKVFLPSGDEDGRDDRERYLNLRPPNPGHPWPVPRPAPSIYMRYINVENQDQLPTVKVPDGFDLRLISWGDGKGVPTTGQSLAIVGTDNDGLLHIRMFDASGVRTDTFETRDGGGALHLRSADASGRVLSDPLESTLTTFQNFALGTLKAQLPGLLPRQPELTDAEKGRVFRRVTTIIDKTPPDQIDFARKNLPQIGSPDTLLVTYYITPEGIYPKKDPFANPPGTNLLPTVYQDARDGKNNVMINTLPSTPGDPYHLHAEPPRVTPIDPASPTDDLGLIIERIYQIFTGTTLRGTTQGLEESSKKVREAYLKGHEARIKQNAEFLRFHLKWAIDIIEGNPISGRAYSGFPLLHHSGQNRVKRVRPILGADGKVAAGEVEVNQVWYDQRIESDTMFFDFYGCYKDPKLRQIPDYVPWTITYKINVLDRGSDDFSTTTMFFDDPVAAKEYFAKVNPPTPGPQDVTQARQTATYGLMAPPSGPQADACKLDPNAPPPPQSLPHISMDQTFFPMDAGTQTIVKIKMPPHKYYNLTYTWGWRIHPPRAQAIENAHKTVKVIVDEGQKQEPPRFLVDFEKKVFEEVFPNPIDAISDLAPAKRMWRSFKDALAVVNEVLQGDDAKKPKLDDCLNSILEAREAYLDWKDRTHLPSGLRPDPSSDLTLFYANNTIYGELADGAFVDMAKWRKRGTDVRVTLINGDYFDHGYVNIDFGGNRGWENQFKSSIAVAGIGSFFTFGRFHWWMNTNPGTITVPAAKAFKDGKLIKQGELPDVVVPGVHRVWIQLNHDPSRRLRLYQFDPEHHDVNIYSIH
jgi:hypothetical protein